MAFEDRLLFGQEAEDLFEQTLKKEKISYIKLTNLPNWSKEYDLKYGDFQVGNIYQDIKRNSISKKSIDNFKGEYFVVYNLSLSMGFVIQTKEMKHINSNAYTQLTSGDLGLNFAALQRFPHISLEEFINILKVKRSIK